MVAARVLCRPVRRNSPLLSLTSIVAKTLPVHVVHASDSAPQGWARRHKRRVKIWEWARKSGRHPNPENGSGSPVSPWIIAIWIENCFYLCSSVMLWLNCEINFSWILGSKPRILGTLKSFDWYFRLELSFEAYIKPSDYSSIENNVILEKVQAQSECCCHAHFRDSGIAHSPTPTPDFDTPLRPAQSKQGVLALANSIVPTEICRLVFVFDLNQESAKFQ